MLDSWAATIGGEQSLRSPPPSAAARSLSSSRPARGRWPCRRRRRARARRPRRRWGTANLPSATPSPPKKPRYSRRRLPSAGGAVDEHALAGGVGDEDAALPSTATPRGRPRLPWPAPRPTWRAHRAVGAEDEQAAVVAVGDVDVAGAVDGDAVREAELRRSRRACGRPVPVRSITRTFWYGPDGRSRRGCRLCRTRCPAAASPGRGRRRERALVGAVAVVDVDRARRAVGDVDLARQRIDRQVDRHVVGRRWTPAAPSSPTSLPPASKTSAGAVALGLGRRRSGRPTALTATPDRAAGRRRWRSRRPGTSASGITGSGSGIGWRKSRYQIAIVDQHRQEAEEEEQRGWPSGGSAGAAPRGWSSAVGRRRARRRPGPGGRRRSSRRSSVVPSGRRAGRRQRRERAGAGAHAAQPQAGGRVVRARSRGPCRTTSAAAAVSPFVSDRRPRPIAASTAASPSTIARRRGSASSGLPADEVGHRAGPLGHRPSCRPS